HAVNGNPMVPPFPAEMQMAIFGMGCFWGAEQLFWEMLGVFSTQVGYAGGFTPNPTYEEVRTGNEGLLFPCCDGDPPQCMRQQEDLGTQYRSVIYTLGPQQQAAALHSKAAYQQ
ncbi:MSRA reductase, partial [Aramus guarauna]|nr:MSRA reductase [Aramus guarauna]